MKITKPLIEQVKKIYNLEKKIAILQDQVTPLKVKLKIKVPYGIFKVGSLKVSKINISGGPVSFERPSYDQLRIYK